MFEDNSKSVFLQNLSAKRVSIIWEVIMSLISKIQFNGEIMDMDVNEGIVRFTIKNNALSKLANAGYDNILLRTLKLIARDKSIRMIVFYNEPNAFDDLNYYMYLKSLFVKEEGSAEEHAPLKNTLNNIIFFQNIIKALFNTNKLTVGFMSGRIVTSWAAMFLALDMRFASENMMLSFAHQGYGLHPSGGFPFFLNKYIGYGKANEILLTARELSADDAIDLNLISGVFPDKGFTEVSRSLSEKMSHFNKHTIENTKRLNFKFREELDEYFTEERGILTKDYKII